MYVITPNIQPDFGVKYLHQDFGVKYLYQKNLHQHGVKNVKKIYTKKGWKPWYKNLV